MLAHVALQTVAANAHVAGADNITVAVLSDALRGGAAQELTSADVVVTGVLNVGREAAHMVGLTSALQPRQICLITPRSACASFQRCAPLLPPASSRAMRASFHRDVACMRSSWSFASARCAALTSGP